MCIRDRVGPLVHGADPLRVGVQQAVLCKDGRHGGRAPEPVGVDPGLQRKSPGVGLGQQHVQRVKARVLPLHAGAQAVSYTHLDVYKRQTYIPLSLAFLQLSTSSSEVAGASKIPLAPLSIASSINLI